MKLTIKEKNSILNIIKYECSCKSPCSGLNTHLMKGIDEIKEGLERHTTYELIIGEEK